MSDKEKDPARNLERDGMAEVRMYGDHLEIPQGEAEGDSEYRNRIAGALRGQGRVIEAHEVLSGKRWDDPDQGETGPFTGILGAMAQALNGRDYSPYDPSSQVGDDIAVGYLARMGAESGQDAIGALFDQIGPAATMDLLEAFTSLPRHED